MWRSATRGISSNALRFQSRAAFKPQSQLPPQQKQQTQPSPAQPQQTPPPPQQQPDDAALFSDDWSKSFSGLSTQRVDPEVEKLLTQPVDELDVEVKPGRCHCTITAYLIAHSQTV